jgi:glycosyltransferase involved in cell wall biosynthesis
MFVLAKLCSLGLKIPIIASDHTMFNRKVNWHFDFIRFYGYNLADAVTILTKVDYDFLGKRLPQKVVMPNPVQYQIFSGLSIRKKTILAAGRLDVWWIKGFDILIETWGRIAPKYPDWQLEIAGSGSDIALKNLEDMAVRAGVSDRVAFLGFCKDIDKIMQESAIFVLSSRCGEGLGLVLLEAMSQGCACISFELDGRQREIITSPKSGLLIENENRDALEKALITLIENDTIRLSIAEAGRQEVLRYSKETVTDRWESLLIQVTKNYNIHKLVAQI